jgi:hypothetical protein
MGFRLNPKPKVKKYSLHPKRTLPNASSMLASFVTRLTRMGVKLLPSSASRPLVNAAADTCTAAAAAAAMMAAHHKLE